MPEVLNDFDKWKLFNMVKFDGVFSGFIYFASQYCYYPLRWWICTAQCSVWSYPFPKEHWWINITSRWNIKKLHTKKLFLYIFWSLCVCVYIYISLMIITEKCRIDNLISWPFARPQIWNVPPHCQNLHCSWELPWDSITEPSSSGSGCISRSPWFKSSSRWI
jgi:hypothetical protein